MASILVLSLILSGCGTAKSGGPVKIQIFVGIGTGDAPDQVALHKTLQDEFNASHKDIQIEFLTTLNAEARTKFSTMLASGSAPDLVMPIASKVWQTSRTNGWTSARWSRMTTMI